MVFDLIALQRLHLDPGRRPEIKAVPKEKVISIKKAFWFHS
jgi:hypothetical protein